MCAAAVGHRSGRATPSLRDAPQQQSMEIEGRETIYRNRNAVQTNPATSIRQVRSDGMEVSNDDIAHLSPLIWRHLSFLGQYGFSLPDTVINGGLRPLRNPTSAWDF